MKCRILPMFAASCMSLVCLFASADDAKKPKYDLDLSDRELPMKNYDGKVMERTNFENSKLFLTTFKGAILTDSNFQGTDLTSTSFNGADLTRCDFRDAETGAASFQKAKFTDADLRGVDMSKASAQGATFTNADLRKCKGIGDITGANFRGANLCGANLLQATDYGPNSAKFKGAKYDRLTRWPTGVDPEAVEAVLVEDDAK
jgi:uncharacterized protein YjbI with pentapeptide repeats